MFNELLVYRESTCSFFLFSFFQNDRGRSANGDEVERGDARRLRRQGTHLDKGKGAARLRELEQGVQDSR